jgi:hypothetical protein
MKIVKVKESMNDARRFVTIRDVDPLKPLGVAALVVGLLTLAPVVQFVTVVTIEGILSSGTGSSTLGFELLVVYGPTSLLNALVVAGVSGRISNPKIGLVTGGLTGLLTSGFLYSVGPLFVT